MQQNIQGVHDMQYDSKFNFMYESSTPKGVKINVDIFIKFYSIIVWL